MSIRTGLAPTARLEGASEPSAHVVKPSCALLTAIVVILFITDARGQAGIGAPVRYLSSCEVDLNNDGQSDVVLLVETVRGRELIVLLKTRDAYAVYDFPNIGALMVLSCRFGRTVTETEAGKKPDNRIHKTSGTYIQLTQPEGASLVYYWNGKGFTGVWTSD